MTNDKKGLVTRSSDQDIDDFFAKMSSLPVLRPRGQKGRLIFAMDATASREPAWNKACRIQSDMFSETEALGGLEIQMAWYRGFANFRTTPWLSNSRDLVGFMGSVRCLGGQTQIEKILDHALDEAAKGKINALVFVGDCVEEDVDRLCGLAGKMGLLGIPAFIFQEGDEPFAARAFGQIAELSGGAHCRFDLSSAQQLRDLLAAVAVYAAGGRKALQDFSQDRGGEVLKIAKQIR
ncbi:MAG: VWA domain-containing protein [Alphaproteobacteria bacterium]|jgi:hypothetical protein|nr:VWA domain-containing protein [Alphaproteobacteria bacterium]MBT4019900.1 VWA domain-containing protein [Alphaproteobacteria bacterium]MBT4965786.1 VWA domain-containing protein [Alphaproteobacteria bacterium]MBT7745945.1 VWA domain-containing protein [Alphaproteobacteria bacterium]